MPSNNDLKIYTINDLVNNRYTIPIYQRNFAWGEVEIAQLIADIADYGYDDKGNYYIGTLVVNNKNNSLEVIDGQQRLTTLYILLSVIKNNYSKNLSKFNFKLNLEFESRPNSTNTLKSIYEKGVENGENLNSDIVEGYKICQKELVKKLNEKFADNECKFFTYLFEKVIILQVVVPKGTDLNHYFEIMNTRGEQLEMHEILKARCLEKLDEKDRGLFAKIWDACGDMGYYVQLGFDVELREQIFDKDCNILKIKRKEDLYAIVSNDEKQEFNNKKSIEWIINNHSISNNAKVDNKEEKWNNERFESVINFPNLLLQVLKIQKANNEIPLDDKKLLETFENFLGNNDKEFSKEFSYNLLKIRCLFDKFIIKRELHADNWSLKNNYSYKDSSDNKENDSLNKEISMLLSMFHTSYPQQAYKNWLYDTLNYLYNETNITADSYKRELKKIAKRYYYETSKNNDNKILDNGTSVPHFIFNYLDYLLWELKLWEKDSYDKHKEALYLGDDKVFIGKIKDFKFAFSNSVEHHYPQNPLNDNPLPHEIVNNFGNLCLISRGKNSKLNNYAPNAKKEHYSGKEKIDSIKQALMMSHEKWGKDEIKKHGRAMKELLKWLF